MKLNNYILTFESTHNALKMEKFLNENNIDVELIPTPREISSECGFTLLLENIDLEKIMNLIKPKIVVNIYLLIKKDKRNIYEKIN